MERGNCFSVKEGIGTTTTTMAFFFNLSNVGWFGWRL